MFILHICKCLEVSKWKFFWARKILLVLRHWNLIYLLYSMTYPIPIDLYPIPIDLYPIPIENMLSLINIIFFKAGRRKICHVNLFGEQCIACNGLYKLLEACVIICVEASFHSAFFVFGQTSCMVFVFYMAWPFPPFSFIFSSNFWKCQAAYGSLLLLCHFTTLFFTMELTL